MNEEPVKKVVKVITTKPTKKKRSYKLYIISILFVLIVIIGITIFSLVVAKKNNKPIIIDNNISDDGYTQEYYLESINISEININYPFTINLENYNITINEVLELYINNTLIGNILELEKDVAIVNDILLINIKDSNNIRKLIAIEKDKMILNISEVDEYKIESIVFNPISIMLSTSNISSIDICNVSDDTDIIRNYSIVYQDDETFSEPSLIGSRNAYEYRIINNLCE